MLHVKHIRDIVDRGELPEAHEALDQLLSLGPNNIEALKLRAKLHEFEGRLAEEAKIWERIAMIDHEDPDAAHHLLRRQLEDREHFYFTDDLPEGGRRFLAHPSNLMTNSAAGLLGCLAFLISTRLSIIYPVLSDPIVMLSLFGLFVMLPWLRIITTYIFSLRWISLSKQGVIMATRLRQLSLNWDQVEKVCLARYMNRDHAYLSLIFVPKGQDLPTIEIDLTPGSSSIRARSYLIKEIEKTFTTPEYTTREALKIDERRCQKF